MNAEATDPRGWYLPDEVGQLAGVSSERIGQWARHGYIRSSRSASAPRVYSFQDIAEAMIVHELIDRRVPVRDIRNAISNLRQRYGDWPLTVAPLATT
ncbi:MAG TPA: MerR family transcriptional regulator, partial [Chloroflexota bacterium]